MQNPILLIDFDSTFIQCEWLEELAHITLAENAHKEEILQNMQHITNLGMEGKIPFTTSLEQRLALFTPRSKDIEHVGTLLKSKITPSFEANKERIQKHAATIYIISGWFKERILPITNLFGIPDDHIFANEFIFDAKWTYQGIDTTNLLAQEQGKVKQTQALGFTGEVRMIGDGYTDYEVKKNEQATKFIAFTENIQRERILENADMLADSFKQVITARENHRSYNVLLLENIHKKAIHQYKQTWQNVRTSEKAREPADFATIDFPVNVLGIRSKTQLGKQVLANLKGLTAIGCFCIGTNQVDIETATEQWIAVFNSPFSNTRSVAELTIGEIIMLFRGVQVKSRGAHAGKRDKSAKNSREIKGKTLGIIWYGNIGSQVSVLAESLGMKVIYYDSVPKLPLGNAQPIHTLKELLEIADVITLHVPGGKQTQNLINTEELTRMKQGSFLINNSRWSVVNIDALKEALDTGKICGAALDVFPQEPVSSDDPFISPLQGYKNVILTPHIGGSTEEAQEKIGEEVTCYLIKFMRTGDTTTSVNLPQITVSEKQATGKRITHIHANVPGMLAQINATLAQQNINIVGQRLKTKDTIGYAIFDIEQPVLPPQLEKNLQQIPGTILVRVL